MTCTKAHIYKADECLHCKIQTLVERLHDTKLAYQELHNEYMELNERYKQLKGDEYE